jgi:hypothetical protein
MTINGMMGMRGVAAFVEVALRLEVSSGVATTLLVSAIGWTATMVETVPAFCIVALASGCGAALVDVALSFTAAGGLFWAEAAKLQARSPVNITMMILDFMFLLLFHSLTQRVYHFRTVV